MSQIPVFIKIYLILGVVNIRISGYIRKQFRIKRPVNINGVLKNNTVYAIYF